MKASADRQKRALSELLAKPGNNVCADCQTPAPRWTSWNLGIFICVQCAAAHRKLGSHISKVKSVTLDTWTKDQIESMKEMGNIKANLLYNPDPLRNPPPTRMDDFERDSELEIYIRNKYQYKAFMKRDRESRSSPERALSILSSRRSPGPGSYRDVIEAVSPIASSLMADMENHTRAQLSRTSGERQRDRSRSTERVSKPSAKEVPFTSVGVTPPGSSRPSTASARMGSLPVITTTSPITSKPRTTTVTGGGFSWAPARTASPATIPKTTSPPAIASSTGPQPSASITAPSIQSQTAPLKAQPERQLSLYEQDLMSLQLGSSNAHALTSSTLNPFPRSNFANPYTNPSPFANTAPSLQPSPFGASYIGTVPPFATGTNGIGESAPNAFNPFTNLQQISSAIATSSPPQSILPQGSGMFIGGPSPHNPFSQLQFTTAASHQASIHPSPSPFQPQPQPSLQTQPQQPSFQPSLSPFPSNPSTLGSSPSPFQAIQAPQSLQTQNQSFQTTSSPFQTQPPFTGAFGPPQQPSNHFAMFAQNMLPQQQPPQQQNGSSQFNPFARQQAGMGVNGWMH